MTTIYVGNLPFNATEQDVRAMFERHGPVESVKLINDRETGKPRGFGFVDMPQNEAMAAIQAIDIRTTKTTRAKMRVIFSLLEPPGIGLL